MAAKKKHIVKFAFTPYHLQQEIISYLDGREVNSEGNPYRFFVVAIGRQAGKSWLAKYTLLDRAINRDQRCVWVAPSIPTARSHWDDLVRLVETSGIPVKKISQASKQIVFMDGGQISVRSAVEPDNMRGLTVDYVVMDEAAFFRGGEYVWYSIVLPMVTASRGVVLFTSTPNGRNWFWKLFTEGQRKDSVLYKSWRAPSTISPYQDPVLLAALKETMPEYQWKEEFEAEFLADSGGVFSGADKAAKITMLENPLPGHTYVAGIDFGFNHDATTITILDKYTKQQVFGRRFYNYGTASTVRQLVAILNVWQPEVTHLEKNGVGESLFEIMKAALSGKADDIPDFLSVVTPEYADTSGEEETLADTDMKRIDMQQEYDRNYTASWGGRLKAVHMDNKLKRMLVERLAADIEYKRLETLEVIPGGYGETQMNEMSTYLRQRTQSGFDITYNAAEGSHDDTVSALYLANKGMPRYKPMKEQLEGEKTVTNPFKNRNGRSHLRGNRHAKRH